MQVVDWVATHMLDDSPALYRRLLTEKFQRVISVRKVNRVLTGTHDAIYCVFGEECEAVSQIFLIGQLLHPTFVLYELNRVLGLFSGNDRFLSILALVNQAEGQRATRVGLIIFHHKVGLISAVDSLSHTNQWRLLLQHCRLTVIVQDHFKQGTLRVKHGLW